jgi:hypothetical protein
LGQNKTRQFERLAKLLEEFFDMITPCFGGSYVDFSGELILAQKNYNKILLEKHLAQKDFEF